MVLRLKAVYECVLELQFEYYKLDENGHRGVSPAAVSGHKCAYVKAAPGEGASNDELELVPFPRAVAQALKRDAMK